MQLFHYYHVSAHHLQLSVSWLSLTVSHCVYFLLPYFHILLQPSPQTQGLAASCKSSKVSESAFGGLQIWTTSSLVAPLGFYLFPAMAQSPSNRFLSAYKTDLNRKPTTQCPVRSSSGYEEMAGDNLLVSSWSLLWKSSRYRSALFRWIVGAIPVDCSFNISKHNPLSPKSTILELCAHLLDVEK